MTTGNPWCETARLNLSNESVWTLPPDDLKSNSVIHQVIAWMNGRFRKLYSDRVLFLFLNLLGIYIIYMATPKNLGIYKYYLMAMQIVATIFDLSLNEFTYPVFCIPAFGVYFMGLASDFGIPGPYQLLFDMMLFLYLLSIVCVTIFQKQQSILDEAHPLRLRKCGKFLFEAFWLLVGPIGFGGTAAVLWNSIGDSNAAAQGALECWPSLRNFVTQKSYVGVNGMVQTAAMSLANFWAFLLVFMGIVIYTSAYQSLRQQRHFMSAKTLASQRKWLRNLNVQVLILLLLTFFPFIFVLYVGIWRQYWMTKYLIWVSAIGCFHGTASTLIVIFLYDSYRVYFFRILKCFFWKQTSNTLGPISIVSISITNNRQKPFNFVR